MEAAKSVILEAQHSPCSAMLATVCLNTYILAAVSAASVSMRDTCVDDGDGDDIDADDEDDGGGAAAAAAACADAADGWPCVPTSIACHTCRAEFRQHAFLVRWLTTVPGLATLQDYEEWASQR